MGDVSGEEAIDVVPKDAVVGWAVVCETVVCFASGEAIGVEIPDGDGEPANGSCERMIL